MLPSQKTPEEPQPVWVTLTVIAMLCATVVAVAYFVTHSS